MVSCMASESYAEISLVRAINYGELMEYRVEKRGVKFNMTHNL